MAKEVFAEAIQHHEAGSLNKAGKLYTNPKKTSSDTYAEFNLGNKYNDCRNLVDPERMF